jgi:hypothetical protein
MMEIHPIIYLCNDPERALGIEDILTDFSIMCIDNSPLIELLRAKNIDVFSLAESKSEVNPTFRSTHNLLHNCPESSSYLSKFNENLNFIFFKSSPRLENLSKQYSAKVLNPSWKLNRKYENKLSQYEVLSSIVPEAFPTTTIGILGELYYSDLIQKLGQEFVVQFDRGHTGDSTFFIRTESDYTKLQQSYLKRKVRVSRKIEGKAWTINASATRFGTLYHGISQQITGVPQLTNQEGGTVGNDWTKASSLEKSTQTMLREIIETVGNYMYQDEYRGMFGFDFIIDNTGRPFLIEINARQPASTGIHSKLMLKAGLPPLLLFHIAEFLFEDIASYEVFIQNSAKTKKPITEILNEISDQALESINASQILIRNKSINSESFLEIPQSGIYSNNNEFISKEYDLRKLEDSSQSLILTINNKQLVSPGYEIGRIIAQRSLIDDIRSGEIDLLLNKFQI